MFVAFQRFGFPMRLLKVVIDAVKCMYLIGSPWFDKLRQFHVVEAAAVITNSISKEIYIEYEESHYKIILNSHPEFISPGYKEFTLAKDGSWTQDKSLAAASLKSCFYQVR